MGKPPVSEPKAEPKSLPRWPFDPMQPGDHEPVQLPEELERLQKETAADRPEQPDKRGGRA